MVAYDRRILILEKPYYIPKHLIDEIKGEVRVVPFINISLKNIQVCMIKTTILFSIH